MIGDVAKIANEIMDEMNAIEGEERGGRRHEEAQEAGQPDGPRGRVADPERAAAEGRGTAWKGLPCVLGRAQTAGIGKALWGGSGDEDGNRRSEQPKSSCRAAGDPVLGVCMYIGVR